VLAQVAVFRGDHQTAALHGHEAQERFERAGDQYGDAWVLSVLGERAYADDDLDVAEKLFRKAATLAEEIGIPQFVANGLQGLGDVEAARDRYRNTERLLAESLRINREIGDTLFVAGVLASLAELAARRGDHRRAARLWGHDQRLREDLGRLPARRRGGCYDRSAVELRAIVKEALGEEQFAQSMSEGADSDLEMVVNPAT